MVADTREYDAFGPWTSEVRTPEDVPALYRDHPLDLATARLVLKVPRDIARRDATADMDLYDHLLTLQPDGLTVLSRWQDQRSAGSGRYEVRHVPYDQIAVIVDEVSLLDGHLRVHTLDGRLLTVRYNGSGAEQVQRLVEALRVLTVQASAAPAWKPSGALVEDGPHLLPPTTLGRDDVGIISAHREVAAHRPELLTLAWHRRQALRTRSGGLRRLSHALSPATLQAGVVAGDDDTLEVFGRREWVTRGRRPDHSLSRLVVVRRALDRIDAESHPDYERVTTLTFVAGGARPGITVPGGSTAERLLTGGARD